MADLSDSAESLLANSSVQDTTAVDQVLQSVQQAGYGDSYRQHVRDQYHLYVEMADRISSRRMLANSFFVGMNTAVAGAIAVSLKEKLIDPPALILAPVVAALLMCSAWWMMVLSYRRLNSAKFKVILAMERLLPLAPYSAEWAALEEKRRSAGYLPITSVELIVPWLFAAIHVSLSVAFLARFVF